MSALFEVIAPRRIENTLEIQSSTGSYMVEIASHSFAASLARFGASVIIADEVFRPMLERARTPAIFIQATEAVKSLNASPDIIEQLRSSGVHRHTHLVAIGGGIVQDISAFIASVYMRGLNWTYVPTTVLAMVDSCIGKSSINVGPYKNLIGTFHPPQRVFVDPALARTLPSEQRASGLIEAAKICFCRGEQSFARYLALDPRVNIPTETLEQIVFHSLEAKKWFIETDEFDRNERLLLNFGHTFGHAFEGASHFAIAHGIAVGLGILCAIEFERQRGVLYTRHRHVGELERHLHALLSTVPNAGLREPLTEMSLRDVLERFNSDKKHTATCYSLIVVGQSGRVTLRKIERSPEVARELGRAIKAVLTRYA